MAKVARDVMTWRARSAHDIPRCCAARHPMLHRNGALVLEPQQAPVSNKNSIRII